MPTTATTRKAKTEDKTITTHGGGQGSKITPAQELRRSVMACMLWEKEFYENGESIADRIKKLVAKVDSQTLHKIVLDAKNKMKLRHAPLFIVRLMAKDDAHKKFVAMTLDEVIQRADELAEFVAMYWADGKRPLSAQVKKGLAKAFKKFDEYQLAKYDRSSDVVKLRDVLFLCHAKPENKEQEDLWKKLIAKEMEVPETWEVKISAAGSKAEKKSAWEDLLKQNKLGALALLRNLRNMKEAGVSETLIKSALQKMKVDKVLPFRFITAARHAPHLEAELEQALFKCTEGMEKLPGKTILIVDVSGSMYGSKVSGKSELDRAQVACSLAILVREMCEKPVIYATAGSDSAKVHKTALVPSNRRGFALSDAIYKMCNPLGGGGIFLKQVMDHVKKEELVADRVIVITDEQDCDSSARSPKLADAFGDNNYIVNVASYKIGIAYEKFTHIDGWSEAVLDFINKFEKEDGIT